MENRAFARLAADRRCSFSRWAKTRATAASTVALSSSAVRRRTARTVRPAPPPAHWAHAGAAAAAAGRDCADTFMAASRTAADTPAARRCTSAWLADFNFDELHGGRAGVADLVRGTRVEEGPVAGLVERAQPRAPRHGRAVA